MPSSARRWRRTSYTKERDLEASRSRDRRQKAGYSDVSDEAKIHIAKQRRDDLKKLLAEGLRELDLEKYRKTDEEIKALKNKQVRKFYAEQNAKLDDWLEVDSLVLHLSDDVLDSMNPDPDQDGDIDIDAPLLHSEGTIEQFLPKDVQERKAKQERKANIALWTNIAANIAILAVKIAAVAASGSLSLLASLADSALDLLCVIFIYITNRLVKWRLARLRKNFPTGRKRLEPLGVLVFSVIMVISFVQIIQESVQKLLPSGDHSVEQLPPIAVWAMGGNALVKGIIGLGCYPIKTTQVQALVQDCWTDVIFNTASLLFPLIGHRLHIWWLDPLGALLLSLYIVYDWSSTCLEIAARLSGVAVERRLLQKMLFLCYRFSPLFDSLKNLVAYHAGDGVWVEYDIVLNESTPLHRVHDIAETLQYCSEGLNEVDRSFVSTDYAIKGPLGHVAS